MKILYEDNEILVCEKPAGVATESASVSAKDMLSMVKTYLKGAYTAPVHRLDQPVSGILVFAKTPAAAAGLSAQVRTSDMCKQYLAVVEGKVEAEAEPVVLTDYLIRDAKIRKALVVDPDTLDSKSRKAKCARLTYEVISFNATDNTTLLKIRLLSGRFHQIRAQLSHIGHPILNDVKYGAKKPAASGAAGIALCANELRFLHPKTNEEMVFFLDQIPNSSL